MPEMNPQLEVVIYRIAQDCLANIAQHSAATRVNISLNAVDGLVKLQIEDDGIGFDPEQAMERKDRFGLVGIRERISLLGGRFIVRSTPSRGGENDTRKKPGTRITVELPISSESSGYHR
jgi:signal transduction histidine kinase